MAFYYQNPSTFIAESNSISQTPNICVNVGILAFIGVGSSDVIMILVDEHMVGKVVVALFGLAVTKWS